jgi:hypothetical protein
LPPLAGTFVAFQKRDPPLSGRFMITSEIQAIATTPSAAAQPAEAGHHAFTFHDVLSAMNPLQYLPIVGTIYRAVTGDAVSEPVREAGSLLFSVLLGGPIGLISSIATTIAEKISGIDPEKIIAAQFHTVRAEATVQTATGKAEAAPTQPAAVPAPPVAPDAVVVPTSTQRALTQEQLAAYGVRSTASGTLKLGDAEDADVLNTIQLLRLDKAAAVYAANQMTPLPVRTQGI